MKHGFGYRTDQRLRKENQDTFGAFSLGNYALVVVCDGMGGHVGGAQASALAVRTVHDAVQEALVENTGEDPRLALKRAVELANRTIYETARKNYRLSGMGTTCVAALIEEGGTVHFAHVGDSRGHLLHGGSLSQVTRDHTMVNLFVDAELLPPEDAATHPEAHVLSRSLGVERHVDVDLAEAFQLAPGDRLILTSDGVHGPLGAMALSNIDWSTPQEGANAAMGSVERANGDDNATVVCYAWNYTGPSSAPTSPPDPDAIAAQGFAAINESIPSVPSLSVMPIGDAGPVEEMDDLAGTFGGGPTYGGPVEGLTAQHHSREEESATSMNRRAEAYGAASKKRIFAAAAFALAGVLLVGAFGLMRGGGDAPTPTKKKGATATTTEVAKPAAPMYRNSPDVDGLPFADPWPGDGSMLVVDQGAWIRGGGNNSRNSELIITPGASPTLWAPPPRCLDCTRSMGLPNSLAYLPVETSELLAGAFFRPNLPTPPVRPPHQGTKYADKAPPGPSQAMAMKQARNKECGGALDTIGNAMLRSIDHAVLYRSAWLCFNESHQNPLLGANSATFEAFTPLLPHFQGKIDAPPAAAGYAWTWEIAPKDGLEYRLTQFLADLDIRGFQDVALDMLGEETVADHLGADLLLEATAAAAASRSDTTNDQLVDMWARRVYYTTMAMEGSVGELVRRHRPELAKTISDLLFEATGGDAGAQAVADGELNTFVPLQVAKAQAKALGLAPRVAEPVVAAATPRPEPVAPRPASSRPAYRPAPRPQPAAPPPTPQPPPPKQGPQAIKVYRLRK